MQLSPREPCGARRFLGLLTLLAQLQGSLGDCQIAALPKFRYSEPSSISLPTSVRNRDYVVFKCKPDSTKIPGRREIIVCCDNSWGSPEDPCGRSCPLPPELTGTKLKVPAGLQYFHIGKVVKYDCVDGYARVPGTKNFVLCGNDLQWSQPEEFCKVSCPLPPNVNGATLKREFQGLAYFPSGSVVKYDCSRRFKRVPGTENSVHCDTELKWSQPEEFCKVSCVLPPILKSAKLKDEFKGTEYFPPGTTVKYDCIDGYVHLPGTANSISCDDDLRWSRPQKFCQGICPSPPDLMGAKLKTEYTNLEHFFPGVTVKYDCDNGYKHVPGTDNSISCGNNFKWSRPQVFCKVSCPLPPSISGAKLREEFKNLEYFPVGKVVKYDCDEGYKRLPGTANSLHCGNDLQWSQSGVFCGGAKLKKEFQGLEYFALGSIVEYDCDQGFQPIPGTVDSIHCSSGSLWSQHEVFCKVMECEDPVIEHGVKLSGFRDVHIYGNDITFECNFGYFMIGSFLIHCGENSTWNPKVPSCEKINAKLCGTPMVPSGSVEPLQPQYKIGAFITIQCNPQYSFLDETMEMSTVCQGHNLWKPPIQPCLFGASPDTSVLTIRNGRVVYGKKKRYNPGDTVTIQCYAGFTLQGPSVIRYIGGKKWIPKTPYCSLSIFFILLIAAIIFFILLVGAKRVKQIYS